MYGYWVRGISEKVTLLQTRGGGGRIKGEPGGSYSSIHLVVIGLMRLWERVKAIGKILERSIIAPYGMYRQIRLLVVLKMTQLFIVWFYVCRWNLKVLGWECNCVCVKVV